MRARQRQSDAGWPFRTCGTLPTGRPATSSRCRHPNCSSSTRPTCRSSSPGPGREPRSWSPPRPAQWIGSAGVGRGTRRPPRRGAKETGDPSPAGPGASGISLAHRWGTAPSRRSAVASANALSSPPNPSTLRAARTWSGATRRDPGGKRDTKSFVRSGRKTRSRNRVPHDSRAAAICGVNGRELTADNSWDVPADGSESGLSGLEFRPVRITGGSILNSGPRTVCPRRYGEGHRSPARVQPARGEPAQRRRR